MPTYIDVDPASRTVFSRIEGALDFAACKDHMERLLADSAFQPTFSQVIDFRKADSLALSTVELRTLANHTIFSPTSRRAFLVSTDVQFGMARMFSTHRDLHGERFVGVFRSIDQAAHWIGQTPALVEEKLNQLGAGPTKPE